MVKKRVPLGKPIEWSEADLDALATISEADIVQAKAHWKRNAPKKYKTLLDAVPEIDDART